jgi:hypothetical protein
MVEGVKINCIGD